MDHIYLDNNASSPLLPAVLEAMCPYLTTIQANPASAHGPGRRARQALEDARERVAACLGAQPDEVIFTSSGTEANNLAILGLGGRAPGHVLVSSIEHSSAAEPVRHLAELGTPFDHLSVDKQGIVRLDELSRLVRPETHLLVLMLANNETGALQPVAKCRQLLSAESPIGLHCDAVQAVGRVPVDFGQLGVSTLSLSAHKFHGPKGIGALLVRRGTVLQPLLLGGHQQRGLRPGTQPVALAVGLATALDLASCESTARRDRVLTLRRRLLTTLQREVPPVVLNGPPEGGVPHTLNLSFPGCPADALLMMLDLAGVACSTGSACSSGSLLPSPVLKAMGLPPALLHSAMRFSLSHLLTETQIDEASRRIAEAVRQMRALGPV